MRRIIQYVPSTSICSSLLTRRPRREQSQAASLASQWKGVALGPDNHILATYGDASSYTSGYNLFADRWLGTNIVDSSVRTPLLWTIVGLTERTRPRYMTRTCNS